MSALRTQGGGAGDWNQGIDTLTSWNAGTRALALVLGSQVTFLTFQEKASVGWT